MTAYSYDAERIDKRIISFLEAQTPVMAAEARATHVGTRSFLYGVSNAACRGILNSVSQDINLLGREGQIALLDLLAGGTSHEEKSMVGFLLKMRPGLRAHLPPPILRRWISAFDGWAQIDALCQNVFTAEEMLTDWPGWNALLDELSRSTDERDQRAGLVLLVGPVRRVRDPGLVARAETSLRRALEFDGSLVQRAVSWLLREMVRRYAHEVERFLQLHESEMPGFVVREVSDKFTRSAL